MIPSAGTNTKVVDFMSIQLYNNALQRKLMRQANEVRKPLDLSRGPSIDMDKCVEAVGGNRFNLVLIASARTRERDPQTTRTQRQARTCTSNCYCSC